MLLNDGIKIANKLKALLEPYCERIEIAGSIRREKEIVKDVELVLIPKNANKLFNVLGLHLLKTIGEIRYLKNGDKYKQFFYLGIKIDLFVACADNWGWIYFLRTGSEEFGKQFLWKYKKKYNISNDDKASDDGFLRDENGVKVITLEEIDIFKLINLPYVEPNKRS